MRAGWRVALVLAVLAAVAAGLLVWQWGRSGRPGLQPLGSFRYGNYTYLRARLWYGDCPRCYVVLEVPEGVRSVRVAYVVHGGGFIAGRATGFSNMARFFLERGYVVASIEYRLCTDSRWLTVVGDIARGVKYTRAFLEEEGYRVEGSVYIGGSAGAVAGAVLIYDPPSAEHDISGLVDGFIGLSGGYCLSALRRQGRRWSTSYCGTSLESIVPFDSAGPPPRRVPALLINGNNDTLLDRDAGSGDYNSHALCMERYLEGHGVPVRVVIVDGLHSAPMRLLGERGSAVYRAVEEFVGSLGG